MVDASRNGDVRFCAHLHAGAHAQLQLVLYNAGNLPVRSAARGRTAAGSAGGRGSRGARLPPVGAAAAGRTAAAAGQLAAGQDATYDGAAGGAGLAVHLRGQRTVSAEMGQLSSWWASEPAIAAFALGRFP